MLGALGLAGPADLVVFMAAVLVLNATLGVDMLLTITRTLQGGARAGAAALLGITAGCAVHVLAAALGLAALLAASPQAFVVLKWAGAAYLLWLAVGMARRVWQPSPAGVPPASGTNHFRAGLLTNLLNPKVALFFLAFVPQFIAPATPYKTLTFLGLGALALVQGVVFMLALIAVVARLRRVAVPRAVARALHAIGASLFAGLAVRLVRS